MSSLVGTPSLCATGVVVGETMTSSLVGERVRVQFPAQCKKGLQVGLQVVAALRDHGRSNGEKPWDTQQRALFLGHESATETNAVATDFIVERLGYALGTESEEDESEEFDEDAEVLRVDNESMDDADQLDISRLGIPAAVVSALEKRGITQLFPIQVLQQTQFLEGSRNLKLL